MIKYVTLVENFWGLILLFFMCRRIGEYISLELFYFVNLTSGCSLKSFGGFDLQLVHDKVRDAQIYPQIKIRLELHVIILSLSLSLWFPKVPILTSE